MRRRGARERRALSSISSPAVQPPGAPGSPALRGSYMKISGPASISFITVARIASSTISSSRPVPIPAPGPVEQPTDLDVALWQVAAGEVAQRHTSPQRAALDAALLTWGTGKGLTAPQTR